VESCLWSSEHCSCGPTSPADRQRRLPSHLPKLPDLTLTAEDVLVRNRVLLYKLSTDLIEYETLDARHLANLIEEYAAEGDLSREQPAISLNGHQG
jgi:hypothetical protein